MTRLSLQYAHGGWRVELGKQVIRWGRTDLWSPSDRFAPRDLLYPLEPTYLAVTGVRAGYGRSDRYVEAVYVPRFTPSRLPLPQHRWLQLPPDLDGYAFRDIGNRYPGGGQAGVRYSQSLHSTDFALSYFEGFNHMPSVTILYNPFTDTIKLRRDYPRIRMFAGDVSRATKWFVVRGEAASFTSPTPFTDDYVQWVVEAERTQGPVTFIAGYVGESITTLRAKNRVSLDRSLTDLFLGKALWTIGTRNAVQVDLLLRRLATAAVCAVCTAAGSAATGAPAWEGHGSQENRSPYSASTARTRISPPRFATASSPATTPGISAVPSAAARRTRCSPTRTRAA